MENFIVYRHISPSNKVYIGITCKKLERRCGINGDGYKNQANFYRAIQKYGWENFKHEILFEGLTKEEACKKEIEFIALHKSTETKFGYNKSLGGDVTSIGHKLSASTKDKIRNAIRGKKYGPHSEDTKRKISEAKTGKKRAPYSEKTRKKFSEAKTGTKNPFFGKTHSEEVRRNISEFNQTMVLLYREYKRHGGYLKWQQFLKIIKELSN